MLQERLTVDYAVTVQGKAEILGERALARTIEAGHPHPDLVSSADVHGGLHLFEQVFELLLDPVGYLVFGDFRPQPCLLGGLIGDDLLDRAVDVPAGIEKGADRGHGDVQSCHIVGIDQLPTWTER